MLWRRRKRRDPEISPDEILLDVSSASSFDRRQFEGRLEQPLSPKTYPSIMLVFAALFAILLARSGYLELVQGAAFAA